MMPATSRRLGINKNHAQALLPFEVNRCLILLSGGDVAVMVT